MTHTPAEAQERLFEVACRVAHTDLEVLVEKMRDPDKTFVGRVGHENYELKGLIALFMTHDELRRYFDVQAELYRPARPKDAPQGFDPETGLFFPKQDEMRLFDPAVAQMLATYQAERPDAARALCETVQGEYVFLADGLLENATMHGKQRMQELLPQAVRDFPGIAAAYGKEHHFQCDVVEVYRRMIADSYRGRAGKRIHSSLHAAVGLGKHVVVNRQTVVPQEEDEIVTVTQGGKELRERMSRLGTGEVLWLGPYGIERRMMFKIMRDAAKALPQDYVLAHTKGKDAEPLPVVAELQEFSWDPSARRCVAGERTYLPKQAFSDPAPWRERYASPLKEAALTRRP